MNKKTPLVALIVMGLATLAQSGIYTQQASAATKNYTVTVKYVGNDKKTLKTQKVKLASGKTYTPQRYTFKNYTAPKNIAKVKVTGNKTVTVKYNHIAVKTAKKAVSKPVVQANVNVKFNFKGSDGRNLGTKTIQVPKGQNYTYVAPKASELAQNNSQANYYTDAKVPSMVINPTGNANYNITYTRKYNLTIKFVDENGKKIVDQSYENRQQIPDETVTLLDGESKIVQLPSANGNLQGWSVKGVDSSIYRAASGAWNFNYDGHVQYNSNGTLSIDKIDNGWSELRDRRPEDGNIEVSVTYTPIMAYWKAQYAQQADQLIDQKLQGQQLNQAQIITANAMKKQIKNQFDATDSELISAISNSNGSWKAILDGWRNTTITPTATVKVVPNHEDAGWNIYSGLSTDQNDDLRVGSSNFENATSNYTLKTNNSTYFVVQNPNGELALALQGYKNENDYDTYRAE